MSEPAPDDVEALDRALLARFPLPHHSEDGDKEERGRLLVIAGSRELAGAALLAGLGGLRAGAGKLQIATAASIAVALGVAIPESRVIGCEEDEHGCLAEGSFAPLLRSAGEAQAIVIGCGLQPGPALDHLLDALLASRPDGPLVLDAAALGCLPGRAGAMRAWEGGKILLPHSREMARLLECEAGEIEADPLAAARRAAARYGAISLIKGQWSFVVTSAGRAFRFRGGGIGLATSGSGDALAGIVGGLCARGADPLTALLWGVWLHGEAGRLLAERVGRIGFLSREILDLIPQLMED